MVIFIIIVCHWYVSLFFQTFFLHRYASHGMYSMNKFWERVFYLLTFISQGSSFLNPAAYAVMHRRHHSYADTTKDPHSPVHIKNIFEFNKRTFLEYRSVVDQFNNNEINVTDVPRWPLIEKLSDSLVVRALFILSYIYIYMVVAPSGWYYFLIPLHIFMGAVHGFIVNWFGHLLGYRNFNLKDNSMNTLPVDFLMMGELYQNNHHKMPVKRNFASRWFEIDFGYIVTIILQILNIIKPVKDIR